MMHFLAKGRRLTLLPRIRPMRLRLVKSAFDHPDYIFELKEDGFRALAYIQSGECKLISRNLKSVRFPVLRTALAKLPVENAILDGEIISLDSGGVSRFNDLLSRKCQPVLYAFDLLWLDGKDLRQRPLLERKSMLEQLVRPGGARIMYAQHVERDGKALFQEICRMDLEGIVAKRKLGIYKDDGLGWLKIKNPKYTQAEGRRHELLTRGK
jgi:bifunctional non-homologous end joining protein LigD